MVLLALIPLKNCFEDRSSGEEESMIRWLTWILSIACCGLLQADEYGKFKGLIIQRSSAFESPEFGVPMTYVELLETAAGVSIIDATGKKTAVPISLLGGRYEFLQLGQTLGLNGGDVVLVGEEVDKLSKFQEKFPKSKKVMEARTLELAEILNKLKAGNVRFNRVWMTMEQYQVEATAREAALRKQQEAEQAKLRKETEVKLAAMLEKRRAEIAEREAAKREAERIVREKEEREDAERKKKEAEFEAAKKMTLRVQGWSDARKQRMESRVDQFISQHFDWAIDRVVQKAARRQEGGRALGNKTLLEKVGFAKALEISDYKGCGIFFFPALGVNRTSALALIAEDGQVLGLDLLTLTSGGKLSNGFINECLPWMSQSLGQEFDAWVPIAYGVSRTISEKEEVSLSTKTCEVCEVSETIGEHRCSMIALSGVMGDLGSFEEILWLSVW